ncbi:HNH endonuclease [Halotia branconii]|uniref:HNH endonuclease n=1 Tax=Halotia branconii CENA392 TaxID=1539056 RepID=A0AAJ6NRM8_9CYAN|nr:HNH endonuclease [Halotia branconii]WGV25254.1 HNH endonuclease [Halotia branconii CENA392]
MNTQQRRNKKQQLISLYESYCWWCGEYVPLNQLTIEHLLPKSLGGSNSFENLRPACLYCNRSRGNSLYPPGWIKGKCFLDKPDFY